MPNASSKRISAILGAARHLAAKYYKLTGKPLGITGEIGECEAAMKLGLQLADARTPGYDATRISNGRRTKIQIKSRSFSRTKKLGGQRIGTISLKYKWDVVVLVLMDELFEPYEMYEATRRAIKAAIEKSAGRVSGRGALAVSKFKQIGTRVWPRGTRG